ncbi:MAG: indolepyruvate ferredoxin oxidoreductase [Nitriliruptoraceae bacterium]|jgi:indolepyruvate ferredoxin oxidoreductase
MSDVRDDYRLDDRYLADAGQVFLTGIQALARIPIEQLRRDRLAGKLSAALVSGYPGSPLGGYDLEMSRVVKQVPELPIVHRMAANEELGATAIMGSQLASTRPDAKYDGVVGIWYGKAPGLDRAADALRHGVFAGSSHDGGALALVGDDPNAKSSTMPSSSDAALVDLHMPILYPGTIAECIELGLHGVAMSRATGLWSALKIVTPVADGSGTVELPVLDRELLIPTHEMSDGTIWQSNPSAQFLGPRMVAVEREFHEIRSKLAFRYGVDNKLNRVTADPSDAWIAIVATGYTYYQTLEALARLGLADEAAIEAAGIRMLHLRMPVPFDPSLVRDVARGVQELVVVEEKNPTLERLVKDALYDHSHRPKIVGKAHDDGSSVLPTHGQLDADVITPFLRERLSAKIADRLAPLPPKVRTLLPLAENRTPFFCSGCPHNWGVKAPTGAVVGSGTGCHGMTLLMESERVGDSIGITAMGNEGAQWIGMSSFVETDHVFQNLGDGTYFHSGQLAVQAAIGAGVNMTFKILYNDTTAMTGGQVSTYRVGVPELARILLLQGVARVMVTTDDLKGYDKSALPKGVTVWDRTRIVEAQEVLAEIEGTTVLFHEQECSTEVRRERRRGTRETPNTRVVINHRVCEGCGDCGDVSSCLSVQPLDTPLGRKTTIDQASCNLDMSCLHGDCPAFMTIEVDPDEQVAVPILDPDTASLPLPPAVTADTTAMRTGGIGGTGVVTAAQMLATAALLVGVEVDGLDQTGLSQKAGPVVSDIVFTRAGAGRRSNLVGTGQADVIVAFDQLTAAADGTLLVGAADHTVVVASTHRTPTGRQVVDPSRAYPSSDELQARLAGRSDDAAFYSVDAAQAALALTGTAATANVLLLGLVVQLGVVPVPPAAMEEAIRLNGLSIDQNLAAFGWGRRAIADRASFDSAVAARAVPAPAVEVPVLHDALAHLIGRLELDEDRDRMLRMLAADCQAHTDAAYGRRFLDLVVEAHVAERLVTPGQHELVESVARGFHKLLAYKDEYEVARLLRSSDGMAVAKTVAGTDKPDVTWHLHPPTLRAKGMGKKIAFPSSTAPAFTALAKLKKLRGTKLDPFGGEPVRVLERELPGEYERAIKRVLAALDEGKIADAISIAALPDQVRGYEDLKLKRAAAYRTELTTRVAAYEVA